MDEATAELLSRHLDGDLDAAETRRLEQRLATEPGLAVELEALRRLQLQVRSVAERMQLPADLEAPPRLPGRGAAAFPRRVPPAVRWLGLAAGLALAVTVAVEVAHKPAQLPAPDTATRSPGAPAVASPQAAGTTPAPAPAAAPPRSDDEVAETDAASPAEPAPPAAKADRKRLQRLEHGAPPAAEQKQSAVATGRAAGAPTEVLAASEGALADRAGQPPPNETAAAAAPGRERADPAATDEAAREREPARHAASSEQAAFAGITAGAAKQEGAAAARLELIGEDGAVLGMLALPAAAPAPGSRLVVTVAAGVIVAIEPEAADAVADPAFDGLIGRQLPGVADGRYVGVVVGRDPVP
jgi:hypothetical protein